MFSFDQIFSQLLDLFSAIEIFVVMKMRYFIFLLMLTNCAPEYDTKYYKAISMDKRDTAFLKLVTSEGGFYGEYQIKYQDKTTDKGAVKGNVMGDTLIGTYSFLSRGNSRTVSPIAFLRAHGNLKLGSGIAGTYMGFHVYQGGSISFNDSSFQFQPVESKELHFR